MDSLLPLVQCQSCRMTVAVKRRCAPPGVSITQRKLAVASANRSVWSHARSVNNFIPTISASASARQCLRPSRPSIWLQAKQLICRSSRERRKRPTGKKICSSGRLHSSSHENAPKRIRDALTGKCTSQRRRAGVLWSQSVIARVPWASGSILTIVANVWPKTSLKTWGRNG